MNISKLKEKLPYQWRVQTIKDWGADCVAYIDARDVQDRLDEVCGAENWQTDFKSVNSVVYGGIGIKIGDEWVWKWDAGSESNIEKEKGNASDSFKRAGVKWGIGRFLYDLEVVRLKAIKHNDKNYPLNEKTGKPIYGGKDLTDYINNKGKASTPTSKPAPQVEPKKEEVKPNDREAHTIAAVNKCKGIDELQALRKKFPQDMVDSNIVNKAYVDKIASLTGTQLGSNFKKEEAA